LTLVSKKISARPTYLDIERHSLIKRVFAIELSNLMRPTKLLINVDEVSFSHLTKYNYSWAKRGKSCFARNKLFKGSFTMIFAITSRGDWISSPLSRRNNSKIFLSFIERMNQWIVRDLNYNNHLDTIILLDNCRIHKSKLLMESYLETGIQIVFLPPYSPQFAPVELMFGRMKYLLNKH
jgi:transposase